MIVRWALQSYTAVVMGPRFRGDDQYSFALSTSPRYWPAAFADIIEPAAAECAGLRHKRKAPR
ncbi:hypothetical protein DFP91_0324 [Pseudorhodoplanes sinuspersici]|nr:hypothetical protein DFP91_0324 [Pseudorhodoplanes sinuspersici]